MELILSSNDSLTAPSLRSPYTAAVSTRYNETLSEYVPSPLLNNIIHHKSGSNEYKDKQTNTTKLTLSSTYINRNIMVNHVSECAYKLSYDRTVRG